MCAYFQTCVFRNAAQPSEALELISAAISTWLVGLALAALFGRARAYIARTQRLLQSPFHTTLHFTFSIAHSAAAALRRFVRFIVAWLWRRLWKW
jgi:hypothetical protein